MELTPGGKTVRVSTMNAFAPVSNLARSLTVPKPATTRPPNTGSTTGFGFGSPIFTPSKYGAANRPGSGFNYVSPYGSLGTPASSSNASFFAVSPDKTPDSSQGFQTPISRAGSSDDERGYKQGALNTGDREAANVEALLHLPSPMPNFSQVRPPGAFGSDGK